MAVAFSGGVDSTLLLKAATDVCGDKTVAFFARSKVQKKDILDRAKQICHDLSCNLQIVDFDLLSWPEFQVNSAERCYLCKGEIYSRFLSLLPEGLCLADGTNVDDLSQDRPGLRAIRERGVKTPLVQAGLTKKDVRNKSRELGLAGWDQPSESCLATRITTGVVISPYLLQVVEEAEQFLVDNGFKDCRVKTDGKAIFLTLSQGDSKRFVNSSSSREMMNFFAKRKFAKVFLDLSERPGIVF